MHEKHRFSSLVWVKNDLRVRDNPALSFATHLRGPVLALYVVDEALYRTCYGGSRSLDRLPVALQSFERALQPYGIPLLIRKGRTLDEIQKCLQEFSIETVLWNKSLEPNAILQEKKVHEKLSQKKITTRVFPGNLLFDPERLFTKQGKVFRLFTPFWKTSHELFETIQEAPLPQKQALSQPMVCSLTEEKKSWERLNCFVKKHLLSYSTRKDFLGEESTSHLSTALHFGEISVRSLYLKTLNQSEFVRQLIWREFAYYLLFHFPEVAHTPFRKEFLHLPWRTQAKELQCWQSGYTGIPLVDAAMRQLLQTGWMPNRARMVVASFLTKHLLHNWVEGMDWFWNTLFDADLANNSFGWQWVAGCGVDAQPFFRIVNPVVQGQRFDEDGHYVKTYVPELARLPPSFIHCPWKASPSLLRSCGITLGKTYPYPLISMEEGRKRGLAVFREHLKRRPP